LRLLLDSHAMIWWVDEHRHLSEGAYAAIADPANDLLCSAATIWEIAIKYGLGKLELTLPFGEWMEHAIRDLRATVLPISVEYADRQTQLPMHHGDPFDRMLVAQSLIENIAVISNDEKLDSYGVQRLW
jgi:PIN domain nuclease of toxin-antitoxin system